MEYIHMSFEEWNEKYKPTLDFVIDVVPTDADPLTVWTECVEDGRRYIVSGYRFVNRNGYFTTENPFEKDTRIIVDIPVELDEEE